MLTSSTQLSSCTFTRRYAAHRFALTSHETTVGSCYYPEKKLTFNFQGTHPRLTPSPLHTDSLRMGGLYDAGSEYKAAEAASCLGLLRITKVLRALKPVAVAHSDNLGGFRQGASQASSRSPSLRSASLALTSAGGVPYIRDPSMGLGEYLCGRSECSLTQRAPLPPPDTLLDELPMYEPNDLNGPPRTKVTHLLSMRTLPQALSTNFYFPGSDQLQQQHRSGSAHVARAEFTRADRERTKADRSGGDAPLFCRLCHEELESGFTPKYHTLVTDRARATSHTAREVALDTMTLLEIRGYPVDDIMTVWADTLYYCPAFPRIQSLSSPLWSIEKRAERIGDVMDALKRAGIIDLSLAAADHTESVSSGSGPHHLRRVAFDRLEYIGDNCWGTNVSHRIMMMYPDEQWLYSERCSVFSLIRDSCEMNVNLDFVFDTLRLGNLLTTVNNARLGTGKVKADLVEGILGELHLYLYGMTPELQDSVEFVEINGAREAQLVALVQHCLTELYDLIVLQHARQLIVAAIPLAKELAAKRIWLQPCPFLLPHKRSRRASASGGGGNRCVARSRLAPASSGAVVSTGSGNVLGFGSSSAAPPTATRSAPEPISFQLTRPLGDARASPTLANTAASSFEDLFDLAPSAQQLMQAEEASGVWESEADDSMYNAAPDASLKDDHTSDPSEAVKETPAATDVEGTSARLTPALAPQSSLAATSEAVSSVMAPSPPVSCTSVGMHNTRLLPGCPSLCRVPEPYTASAIHPLRHLPLTAIPRMTFCEHTATDVMATLLESYKRLKLLSNTREQTRYVVSHLPPSWNGLIAALAPQAVRMRSSPVTVAGAATLAGTLAGAEDAEVAAARHLLTSMEEGSLYCRDAYYHLSAVPTSSLPTPASPSPASRLAAQDTASMMLALALHNSGLPTLSAKPDYSGEERDSTDGSVSYADTFASSRYVPPGIRPPPAGVVTDRNLCRGIFAFLARGVSDPLRQAANYRKMLASKEKAGRSEVMGPAGTPQAQSENSVTENPVVPTSPPAKHSTNGAESNKDKLTYAEQVEAALSFWRRGPPKPFREDHELSLSAGPPRSPGGSVSKAVGGIAGSRAGVPE